MQKMIKYLHINQMLILLALSCFLSIRLTFPTYAAEKSGSCGENLTWTLSEGTLEISGSGDMTDYADGALAPWFGVAKEIKEIILSSEMTSIGDYAFYGCENVTSITIPEKVLEIGECGFAQCRGLVNLNLGTGVQVIGKGAFQECESLPMISFPASLKEIGEKAFFRCYGFSTLTVPATVENMGTSVFSYCTGLVRASVNASIAELPGWTFYGCSNLSELSLAAEIVSVGDYVFLFCENLNGIYTQSGDIKIVHALEESMYEKEGAPREGLVKAYEMPDSSTVAVDDGKVYNQISVTESAALMVSVSDKTYYSKETNETEKQIKAVIAATEGWKALEETVTGNLDSVSENLLQTVIYPESSMIDSENLELFVGKPVVLQIISEKGLAWKLDMSKLTLESFTGQYELNAMATEPVVQYVTETESTMEPVESENVKSFKESSSNTTSSENLDSSEITYVPYDAEAAAADDLSAESHLTDEDGTTYYVTKRSSKWGITGKQFAIYVGLWVASAVLIVAVVMLSMNQVKKSREQYEKLVKQGEEEDAAAQEALQMELLKEMLNKKQ